MSKFLSQSHGLMYVTNFGQKMKIPEKKNDGVMYVINLNFLDLLH